MNFYEIWKEAKTNNISEESFLSDFLSLTESSIYVLNNGTQNELITFCNVLLDTSIEKLIDSIGFVDASLINPDIILQFSNFEHGVFEVPINIKMEGRPLTFNELGKLIMNSKEDGACKKYGENHSKLAYQLSLVNLNRNGCFYVNNTAFGDFSVGMSKDDLINIGRRLLLRNNFIKLIIKMAKDGNCDYSLLAKKFLSESTAERRKSNVKYAVNLVLNGTKYEPLLKNIVW
ncbi:MAG: hypothetical protein PHN56_05005 [Candidatus Nanoarchaeia archaeon]|nr:hypothetical protein [Candidatus Nanoarchaeia archaeon]